MLQSLRQNILFLIFTVLTLNVVALTGINVYSVMAKSSVPTAPGYETMDCGDAAGRIHKCIRIDPKAGEINDEAKGASYRVIYGH